MATLAEIQAQFNKIQQGLATTGATDNSGNMAIAPGTYNPYSNTITPAQMTPVNPITIAPPPTDLTNYPAIVAGSAQDLQNQATTAQAQLDAQNAAALKQNTDIANMQSLLGGQQAETNALYASSGVNDIAQQLKDLATQATNVGLQSTQANLTLEGNAAGKYVTTSFLGRQQQEVTRQAAIKTLQLSQQSNILQGNYQAAKDAADQIISAKYGQMEADIKAKQTQLNGLRDYVLTPAQEKQKTAQQALLKKQQEDIDKKKADDTARQNLMIEVAKNGVTDPTILSSISNAKTIDEAILSAASSLKKVDTQVVKLDNGSTILIDSNTGKTIKYLGGAKPSDNITIPTNAPENVKGLASIGNLVGGFSSVNAQKMFAKNIQDLSAKGDEKGLAEKIVGQTLANIPDTDQRKKATGAFLLSQQLTGLQKLLDDYDAKGGNTNIFKGKTQEIQNKLGFLGDKDLAGIGVQILNQLDNLARTRTGAVISPSEEELYKRLLPDIGKVKELNDVTISALKTSLMTDVENNFRYNLTTDGLNMIKGTLPEVFDATDEFLNSFSTDNINKNQDNQSFFNGL